MEREAPKVPPSSRRHIATGVKKEGVKRESRRATRHFLRAAAAAVANKGCRRGCSGSSAAARRATTRHDAHIAAAKVEAKHLHGATRLLQQCWAHWMCAWLKMEAAAVESSCCEC